MQIRHSEALMKALKAYFAACDLYQTTPTPHFYHAMLVERAKVREVFTQIELER